jgi:hypothetical protein
LWVLIGAAIALLGTIGVLKRIVTEAGRRAGSVAKNGGKK